MNVLSCDLETFSSVDIGDCGAHKYFESPDFDILLFAYSIDYGPARCVDFASGETLPQEIYDALWDENVEKTAYNAAFERNGIGTYFKRYCPPEQWSCSMVLAASCGLPLSLASAGAALHLPEDKLKMKEGKELIRYFCQPCRPTKTNGMRTRNMPSDDPEKWAKFKEYNIRDVETENTIRRMLIKNRPSYAEHKLWCLDQRINDTGVKVDPVLATNAIAIGDAYKERLLEKAKKLSGLENPNSTEQVKHWLEEQEGIQVTSINKKAVADVVAELKGDEAKDFMKLREEFSKSSTKKYEAVTRCMCADQHVKGCFQFYGASTGRWCLTGDHEILTEKGWVRFDKWGGGAIACWNASTEQVSFQSAKALCFSYSGDMYHYSDPRIDQTSTPDHKMRVKKRYDADWSDMTVEEMSHCRPSIPLSGVRQRYLATNDSWLRVLIMTQADGYFTPDGAVRYHFSKSRKIERCKRLLRKAQVVFSVSIHADGTTTMTIPTRHVPLWLRQFRSSDKTFGWWLLDENADVVFDELPYWDGSVYGSSMQYTSKIKQNADVLQALAHLSGRAAILSEKVVKGKTYYVLQVWANELNSHEIRTKPTVETFDGEVYCAETETGYFLVRRNGKVWVTGNSGRSLQLQNLPQNHMEDLDVARQLVVENDVDNFELFYPNVQGALSELIRTCLIPEEGHRFIVADFSAIEARVIAWMTGEQWRLDTFANGGDIYCASASQMFHVPVEKHGQNSHLRQKGKVAELALGYGGGVGALKAFGADKMGMSEEDMAQTVDLWRQSSPHIVAFWRAMERAAQKCVIQKRPTISAVGNIRFDIEDTTLWMTLPSGRRIAYVEPEVEEDARGRKRLTYMSQNQTTHKWERKDTFGGKIVENCVQATARDCLANAMLNLTDAGYDIRAHVHDEVIITCPIGQGSVEDVIAKMCAKAPWMEGLPLNAEGYECSSYRKD